MTESAQFADFSSAQDWFFLIAAFFCVTCAALAAGLTLGILSLDTLKLQIKTECGTEDEKKAANVILPLVEDRHLLLCTLLIFNSAANEALPIFLDGLVPSYVAVLVSVTLVLICGEVLPAAFFTGPDQLIIASRFRPLVAFLIFIFYPLARPMATGLDNLLGHDEEEILNRDELAVLMQITRHASIANFESNLKKGEEDDDGAMKNMLSQYEVNTITGVLSLASKTVSDIMIPMEKVAMFSSELKLTKATFQQLDKSTHSRVIIYRGNNKSRILGYLELRKLLTVDLDEGRTLGSLELSKVMVISSSQAINEVLSHFEVGSKSQIAIVSEKPDLLRSSIQNDTAPALSAVPLGILTAEDVFQEIFRSQVPEHEDKTKETTREFIQTLARMPSLARNLSSNEAFHRSLSMGPGMQAPNSNSNAENNTKKGGFMHSTILTKFSKSNAKHNESPNEKSNPKVPRTRTSVESEFSKTSKQSLLTGEEKSTTNPIFGFRGKKNRGNGSGGDIEANEL